MQGGYWCVVCLIAGNGSQKSNKSQVTNIKSGISSQKREILRLKVCKKREMQQTKKHHCLNLDVSTASRFFS